MVINTQKTNYSIGGMVISTQDIIYLAKQFPFGGLRSYLLVLLEVLNQAPHW